MSAAMAMDLPLVMHPAPPPLDNIRRHYGQREIDNRQEPESVPIPRHFGEGRTQLVDADDAVDREVHREELTGDKRRLRDRFARPGEPGEEELRQAGGEEDERRCLRPREPGADRL